MSAERTHSPDANPGVSGVKNRVQKDQFAARACIGRYTVDIVSTANGFLALAGDGVGRPPVTAEITPATVALLLEVTATDGVIDERTAWETSAWPLAARGDQEGTADV